MSVLVVGSINVDLVVVADRLPRPGETVLGGSFARGGGGKSANAAVAAARLGAEVALVGAVGADDLGEEALAELRAEGVGVDGVARLEDVPTGVALIVVDRSGENQIAVAAGANGALDPDWVARTVADLGARARVALLGFEVPEAAVAAAATAAAEAGLRVIADPAPARELSEALLASRPLLTPNASEAHALSGESDPEAAARALTAATDAPVLVTLGPGGALLLESRDDSPLRIDAPPVTPVDATGAGDALAGALAAELALDADVATAARRAVAAASVATTRPGARTGPRRDELIS